MEKKINFAIYGCGMIANIHADAILDIKDACLIGAADIKQEYAEKFCKKYSIIAYSDFSELLCDDAIDVVCICTPSGTHAECAIKALSKGKNVILEKPMAITCEECDKIILERKKSGKLLTVISQVRAGADIEKAKQIISSGSIGKILMADIKMKYYRDETYYNSNWKGTLSMDGGGALMNQGIHGIDILQYLMGPVKNIKSIVKTLFHNIETEDCAVSAIEFSSGAIGVIEASTATYPGFSRRIEINGSRGYIVITEDEITECFADDKILIKKDLKTSETAKNAAGVAKEGHKNQIKNFIAALLGKENLKIDEYEGKKAVEIIERIYKNSEEEK